MEETSFPLGLYMSNIVCIYLKGEMKMFFQTWPADLHARAAPRTLGPSSRPLSPEMAVRLLPPLMLQPEPVLQRAACRRTGDDAEGNLENKKQMMQNPRASWLFHLSVCLFGWLLDFKK